MNIPLLLLFWGLWFLNYCSRTIIAPLLPLIEDTFAINHALAGGLFFFFQVGNMTAVFSSGFLSFRIGYKRSILLSFLFLIIGFLSLRFAGTYHLFAACLFMLGLGAGLYLPSAIPLITAVYKREQWGRAVSFHETAAGFSILIVPIITVFALRFFHWRNLFALMSIACLLIVFFLMAFSPDPRPHEGKNVRLSLILRRKDFWIMTTLFTACGVASMGLYNIIPLFLIKERGMPMETANTLFGFSRIGGFMAIIMIGFFLDRFSVKKILLFLLLATGLSTMAVAISHNFWLLSVVLLVQATFSVVFFPAALVAVAKLTDLKERSFFTGILMGIAGIIGLGLSPFILGAVADTWSFQIGIFVVGLLTTLSCFLFRTLQEI
jgi:MFS family permease